MWCWVVELKVGMYIRTKDKNGIQYIRKIVDLPKDTRYGSIIVDKYIHNVKWVSKKNVLKVSYEKMDLIKPGDYVNGKKVVFIDEYGRIALDENDIKTRDVEGRYEFLTIKKEDIKSIVTKEQFESMKYIVEEMIEVNE